MGMTPLRDKRGLTKPVKPSNSGRLRDLRERPYRERCASHDRDWRRREQETLAREPFQASEVLHDRADGRKEAGVGRTGQVSRVVDVPEVDPDEPNPPGDQSLHDG